MTPLQSLKQILQEHLEVCQENDDYKEALLDCIYGCDLSEIAVMSWCKSWKCLVKSDGDQDLEYARGVQFVNDQWNIIKEKEDE